MGCMYVPHVIAVTTQTPVQVHNSDSATHNSAAITKRNGDWNQTQSVGGAPVEHVFSVPEVAVGLKCNMHPWMKAYVAVFSHPYFQVTGKDGSFSLKNVPPGTYTLTAWQERYGTKEQTVTVAPKSEQTVTFTFKADGVDGDSSDDTKMSPARPTRNVHRFAVFTACCTLFLLVAGALVTSNDAGLSVPDWPLSYGSLTPPMVGGIFYEHGHRVIAACVGMLSIALAIWLWRVESRPWVRWLGVAAVGAVVAQGILGGLTVLFFLPPAISSAHAALAQLFFCTILSIALFTSSWWERSHPVAADFGSPRLHSLAAATAVAVFVQLILGAAFRHKGFGIYPHLAWAAVVTRADLRSGAGASKTVCRCRRPSQRLSRPARADWSAIAAGCGRVVVANL